MGIDDGGGHHRSASFAAGKPRQLFEGHYLTGGGYARANYDVSPDGSGS